MKTHTLAIDNGKKILAKKFRGKTTFKTVKTHTAVALCQTYGTSLEIHQCCRFAAVIVEPATKKFIRRRRKQNVSAVFTFGNTKIKL